VVSAALLLGLSLNGGAVLAEGEPVIGSSTAQADFPDAITFSLQATGTSVITDVRLHYRVEHDSYARVISEVQADFNSSTRVSASWTWDMRQSGGLPPGTVVEYWWTVKDAAGRLTTSASQTLSFEDTRFSWHQLTGGNLIFYWYSGNQTAAQQLLDASLAGLAELEAKTGAHLSQPVKVYMYANQQAMLDAMLFPQEWTGAATYPDYATIVIGLAGSDWNASTMVHELAHMVSYQITRNPYGGMPVWLSEGFSMYAEGELDIYFTSTLTSALNIGSTLTVRSLSSPFSADSSLSYLSYAESYSLVDYLVATYGQEKILSLLEVFGRGADYDAALEEVYGFDMDGLYSLWLKYALSKYVGVVAAA
jgi:hypothetical protein